MDVDFPVGGMYDPDEVVAVDRVLELHLANVNDASLCDVVFHMQSIDSVAPGRPYTDVTC